ncbi:MAG: ADOP family duplicated permease [Thermoanaerobaculia bacterium]|nr:ADOP family duplicated permease [Thermoanaerobaculia bacterium]
MFAPLAADLAAAARRLRRARNFALFAATVLALGVGAATALFALVRGVVLRPLPYADPERLVVVVEDPKPDSRLGWPTSPARLDDYNAGATAFAGGIAAARAADALLVAGGTAERVPGARVTGNLFAVLGVDAARGRLLVTDDARPEAPPAAVISYGLWQRRFGGDPDIVGATLSLDGVSRTVVGVAPRGFAWPRAATEVWLPFVATPAERNRAWFALRTVARLAPGETLESAHGALVAVATALDREHPVTDLGTRPRLVPLLDDVLGPARGALALLQGAVLLVLLVAAANFANLLLARGAAREGELAVRAALGGGPRALLRMQLAEALLLGVVGAVLGLLLGAGALRLALAGVGDALPRAAEVRIDLPAAAAALAIALAAATAGALGPALLGRGAAPAAALRGGGKGTGLGRRRRLLAAVVVVEIASAAALAAGGGLLVRSLARLASADAGVDAAGVVTLEIGPSPARGATIAATTAYDRQLLERLSELPGIDAVGAISRLPVVGAAASTSYELETRPNPPGDSPVADIRYVEPGTLDLLGVRRAAGRDVARDDLAAAPLVVLVNEAFARREFAGADPLGRRLRLAAELGVWRTVVGVVGDVHLAELERPVEPTIWVPFPQTTFPSALRLVSLVARSSLPPAEALARLQREIVRVDALQAPSKARPLADAIAGSLAARRFQAGVFAAFATIAALLAAVGIYAVIAYTVAARRDEMAVRLALGADAGRLARDVVAAALRLGAAGLAIGAGLALAGRELLAGALYGVAPWDPAVLGGVVSLVLFTVVLASLAPAMSAARTPPSTALRGG